MHNDFDSKRKLDKMFEEIGKAKKEVFTDERKIE